MKYAICDHATLKSVFILHATLLLSLFHLVVTLLRATSRRWSVVLFLDGKMKKFAETKTEEDESLYRRQTPDPKKQRREKGKSHSKTRAAVHFAETHITPAVTATSKNDGAQNQQQQEQVQPGTTSTSISTSSSDGHHTHLHHLDHHHSDTPSTSAFPLGRSRARASRLHLRIDPIGEYMKLLRPRCLPPNATRCNEMSCTTDNASHRLQHPRPGCKPATSRNV